MITEEIFVKAMTAGGDLGDSRAKELFEVENDKRMGFHLDQLMGTILKGDSPESDLRYCIHQLKSALDIVVEFVDEE